MKETVCTLSVREMLDEDDLQSRSLMIPAVVLKAYSIHSCRILIVRRDKPTSKEFKADLL